MIMLNKRPYGFCGRYWSRPCLLTLIVFAFVKNGSDVSISPVTWDCVQGGRHLELTHGVSAFRSFEPELPVTGRTSLSWQERNVSYGTLHWFRSNVGIATHLTDHHGWNRDAFWCPVMRQFVTFAGFNWAVAGPTSLTDPTEFAGSFIFDFEISFRQICTSVLPKQQRKMQSLGAFWL